MKVIHINHYSPSLLTKDLEQGIFDNWHARTAFYLKKYYPNLQIECWTPERTYKNTRTIKRNNIVFKIFPSSLVVRYGKEISLPMLRALKEEAKKGPILLHIHEPHNYHTYLISLMFNVPIVAQHHGGRAPLSHVGRSYYFLLAPWLLLENIVEYVSFKNIDQFFVLNKRERDYLINFIDKNKVKIQTMGVDFNIFKPVDKLKARGRLKMPIDKKIILFSGSITRRKGIKYVIKALPGIIKRDPNLLFVVVGDGKEKDKLINLAQKFKLGRYIRFTGYVDNQLLPVYLSAADVFIMPSLWEGACISIIEALACNLPVIATDVGNARELINKKNGIIIKAKDAKDIEKAVVYCFSRKFKGMREKSAKLYDWKIIARNTFNVYRRLGSLFRYI